MADSLLIFDHRSPVVILKKRIKKKPSEFRLQLKYEISVNGKLIFYMINSTIMDIVVNAVFRVSRKLLFMKRKCKNCRRKMTRIQKLRQYNSMARRKFTLNHYCAILGLLRGMF